MRYLAQEEIAMARKEKDFGGSSDVNKIPPESRNLRQSGARVLKSRPELDQEVPLETGDPADRPKRPFGLKKPGA
jgi:hypothetical protein